MKQPPQPLSSDSPATDTIASTVDSSQLARPSHIGFWALGIGFGIFLAWAAFAPLDEGVPSAGYVSIDTKRKSVQHLTGGLVKEVLVREGQQVRLGDLLVRMDDAMARANLESVRQRYLGLRAMQGRLLAEQAGQPAINWHPDVAQAASDPLISQQMMTQRQLLSARRAALAADLQGIEESSQGQKERMASFASVQKSRLSQQKLLREELENIRGLVEQGYAPRNRQFELERSVTDLSASLAELDGNIQHARRSVAEMQQRAILRQQEYRKEVETQLAEVTREVLADAQKIKPVREEFERAEIRSPATGQVVGLAFQTAGAVIPPGQKLMDIVPADETLLLETQVPPHMIDRIHQGQPVDARFSGFAHSPQLVVPGVVQSISADLLTDAITGAPYFLARVAVTPDGVKKLGRHQLQPGMPVEVILKTGERTMLTYLLHPLTKRLAASMTEE